MDARLTQTIIAASFRSIGTASFTVHPSGGSRARRRSFSPASMTFIAPGSPIRSRFLRSAARSAPGCRHPVNPSREIASLIPTWSSAPALLTISDTHPLATPVSALSISSWPHTAGLKAMHRRCEFSLRPSSPKAARGMDPTRALLDAVLKYKTLHSEDKTAKNHYLYDDQERFLDFTLGGQSFPIELTPGKIRNQFRSIECQIMDWADDTAYSLNDIADGIHAGFINVSRIEAWASAKPVSDAEAPHLEFLIKAIHEQRVEARLNRCIGNCIRGCSLGEDSGLPQRHARRHQFAAVGSPAVQAQAACTNASPLISSSFHPRFSSSTTRQTSFSRDSSACFRTATSSAPAPLDSISCLRGWRQRLINPMTRTRALDWCVIGSPT